MVGLLETCAAFSGGMKGATETRQQVLSLYRNILRAGRTWQGSAEVSPHLLALPLHCFLTSLLCPPSSGS